MPVNRTKHKLYTLCFYALISVLPFVLQNCMQPIEPLPLPITAYEPVFISRKDLDSSVKIQAAKPLNAAGKIYTIGSYLYINEPYKGVHIYNNADPAKPVGISFIAIPGSHDIAMKNNTLYADNSVDLVAIQFFSGTVTISKLTRIRNKFPEPPPPDLGIVPAEFYNASRRGDSVIIDWRKK